MGNVLDSEGGPVDYRPTIAANQREDELIMGLTSFMLLYNQHQGRLQRASQSFAQAAAQVPERQTDVSPLFSLSGGVLGGACGGLTGGVGGALGAVAAATCARICGTINAVGATVGFFGSVVGGVAGGVFSGSVGGAASVAAEALSNQEGVWFAVGLVTGGAIGGIFGGGVGAAGGAVGGGFGAYCGTGFAVYLVGGISDGVHGTKDSKEVKQKTKKVNAMQKTADEFDETIKPLVQQLKIIKTISGQIPSSAHVQRVAAQTAKTLAAVTAMQDTASVSKSVTPRQVAEELKTMRTEAGKLLVALTKY